MVTETFTAGQDFTVPDGVFSLTVELEGQNGGGSNGGVGGRVAGELAVFPDQTLFIRSSPGGSSNEATGGDSIDIRRGGTTLDDRLAVAAGAGAGGFTTDDGDIFGGDGGADNGEDADPGGTGGTQTNGGNGDGDGQDGQFGDGGDGGTTANDKDGFGGGAGWYGGGGGESTDDFGGIGTGGGGGSNYDDGLDTVTANERGTGGGFDVTITYEQTPGAENLAITDTTATSNTLNWDAPTLPPEVDSVDQYRVYRATDPGTVRADYTEVGTTATPGFTDTGLDNGIEYHYRIGADLFVPEADYTITITDFRGV